MLSKSLLTPGLVAAIIACGCTIPANAQNLQSWLTNAAGQIQQDAASGMINGNQAAGLQNKAAQIQQQEQADMAANGGFLTPNQQSSLGSKLSKLTRKLNGDVTKDTQNEIVPYPGYGMAGTTYPLVSPGAYPTVTSNGMVATPNGYVSLAQWQAMNGGTSLPAGYSPTTGYPTQSGYPYHRHHHNNNTGYNNGYRNGYGSNNGYWGH